MKLVHPILEQHIKFEENIVNIICVENPKYLVKMILDIQSQVQGFDMGEFVLSENKLIDFKNNVELITDIFNLDFNSKKLTNKIHQILAENAVDEEFYLKSAEITSQIREYINELILDSSYDLTYNDKLDPPAIIKMAGIKASEEEQQSILERILKYVELNQELLGTKLFVFVNLKSFLDQEDLKDFYREILYRKINILLLENCYKYDIIELEIERYFILDKDLCEI